MSSHGQPRADTKRCVWLTEEQRGDLMAVCSTLRVLGCRSSMTLVEQLCFAWDAAPADPAAALDRDLRHILPEALMAPDTRKSIAINLLRALGHQEAAS